MNVGDFLVTETYASVWNKSCRDLHNVMCLGRVAPSDFVLVLNHNDDGEIMMISSSGLIGWCYIYCFGYFPFKET